MQSIHYEATFNSSLPAIKKNERELMNFIRCKLPELSKNDEYELRLIFSELIANAVIHGNKKDELKKVTLEADILPSFIIIGKIRDEGKGFNYLELLSSNSNPCDVYNEHGRGIRIVSKLADKLIFNLSGREIIFHKRVSVHG